MTHPQRKPSDPAAAAAQKRRLPYKAIFGGAGLLSAALVAGGAWKAWDFVQNDLAPTVAQELSKSIDRPIELGELKQASLSSLTFGKSQIPPHPYGKDKPGVDQDTASVEEIKVRFNPVQTILSQTAKLDITLVEPKVYLNQTADQAWIETQYKPSDEEGLIRTQVDRVRLEDGEITLDPFQGPTRKLTNLNGETTLKDDYQTINASLNTRFDSGGQAQVQGQWKNQRLSLKTKTTEFQVVPWTHFLPDLPIDIQSGEVEGDFQVTYAPQQPIMVKAKAQITNGRTQLLEPQIGVGARSLNTDIQIRYTPNQEPIITGTAQVEDADATIPEDLVLQTGRSQFQRARDVSGDITFREERVQYDLTGELARGGQFRARGLSALNLSETNVLLSGNNIPASLFDQAYALPINVQSGTVDSNLRVKLRQGQTPSLQGWARLENVNAKIIQMPQPFFDANGTIRVRGLTADLTRVNARYGNVPLIADGTIDPDRGYDIAVNVPPVAIDPALKTLQVESLPFALDGDVTVPDLRVTGAIAAPILAGTVKNRGPIVVDRVPFDDVSAQFRLGLPQLQISEIQAKPAAGGIVTGEASYAITPNGQVDASLVAKNMPGDAIAQLYGASPALTVGPVEAQVRIVGPPTSPTTTADFQAPLALYATNGTVVVESGTTRLQNIVSQVAEGRVLTDGLIQDGQLTAQIRPRGLKLATFSPELRGLLDGQFQVNSPIGDASAQTLRADGNLRLSEGLSLIQDPIDAAIAWDGRQIVLKQARATGFQASGLIGADLESPDGPQITTLDLALNANAFPLSSLASFAPTEVDVSGTADLTGQVSGTLAAPILQANLGLNQLAVSQVAFESRMSGTLAYRPSGVNLDVGGRRDRIQVALADDFLPRQFRIELDEAVAQGQRTGNILNASVEQFPLQILGISPVDGLSPVAGTASGELTANVVTYATQGQVDIEQPSFAGLVGDRITAEFAYQDNVAQIRQGILSKGTSRYQLNARARIDEDPDVEGDLQIMQGQLRDIVALAPNGDTLTPNASAKDLGLSPIGQPQAPLSIQLQQLAQIQALLEQAQVQEALQPLSIADLSGEINGGMQFAGSLNRGITGSFDLTGNDVRLGDYSVDTAIAQGNIEPDGLRFAPLRLASGASFAQYQGTIGINQQSGEFLIRQVPLDPLNQLAALPTSIRGQLNGQGQIEGSLFNPTVTGQLSLAEAAVNEVAIQEAIANFNYTQARLAVDGSARLDSFEPITLTANIPYALPFGSVQPSSDQIAVDISVANEGLGLVSLVTDQVAWQDGQGRANLNVRGTLAQPQIVGAIALQDATLTSPTLDEPIFGVTGNINLTQDQVQIPQLVGRYGETGTIQVGGQLPILASDEDDTRDQLTIALNDLDMNVSTLYEGEVQGLIQVTGAALAPQIGGAVQVQNGRVVLTKVAAGANGPVATEASLAEPSPIRFNQLQVQLGDRVRIIQPPVLSFTATGALTVNGSLDSPQPEGRIVFDKGLINLFTSRFRIDPKRENVAIFDPRNGVDPYLDVGMRATVFEVVGGRTSDLSDFATVSASSLGSVESVRVYAKVDGLASQLQTDFQDVVTISSIPNRDESEIVALLSGGVTDAVSEGQAQNAVANVASASLLGNVQDALSGVLGNRVTVNAFPILLPDVNDDASVLSFGTEVSYDVTDRFSVSALQILTGATQPPIFSARYQLTDALRARASVSGDGEGVGLFEYRIRF